MLARGWLLLNASPYGGSPLSSWRGYERKTTHVTSAWQWRTGASALRLRASRPLENTIIETSVKKEDSVTDSSPHVSIERFVAYLLKGTPLTPEDQAHMVRCYV